MTCLRDISNDAGASRTARDGATDYLSNRFCACTIHYTILYRPLCPRAQSGVVQPKSLRGAALPDEHGNLLEDIDALRGRSEATVMVLGPSWTQVKEVLAPFLLHDQSPRISKLFVANNLCGSS